VITSPATQQLFENFFTSLDELEESMNHLELKRTSSRQAADNGSDWGSKVTDEQVMLVKVLGWPLYRHMVRQIEFAHEDPVHPFTLRQWATMLQRINRAVSVRILGKTYMAEELAKIAVEVKE
jgi:hypothetical protein